MSDNGVLSHNDIVRAAALIDGCRRGARVSWAVNGDVSTILDGVLRHIVDESGTSAYGDPARDIRDQWVRITTGFEQWLSVRDVFALMDEQLFVIDA